MKDLEHCKKSACLWLYRFEIIGVLMIIIATLLTIRSHNGLGIFMLFLVGGALCFHRNCGKYHSHDHENGHNHNHENMVCCDLSSEKTSNHSRSKSSSKTTKKQSKK